MDPQIHRTTHGGSIKNTAEGRKCVKPAERLPIHFVYRLVVLGALECGARHFDRHSPTELVVQSS